MQGLEDLKHSLLYTTLELEATIVSAKEEITRKECELIQANDLLSRVIKERDEAQAQFQKLMLEKLELQQELQQQQQQQQQLVQTHQQQQRDTKSQSTENDPQQGGISEKHSSPTASSDCCGEENSMPSPDGSSTPHPTTPLQAVLELAQKKPLPEKGKLLKAVVEAGPLLQTLLLAGPLPQWQHPPPQLNSIEIPPVAISSPKNPSLLPHQDSSNKTLSFSKKRDLDPVPSSGSDCPVISKCRKVIQNLPQTPTTASHHFLPPHPSFS